MVVSNNINPLPTVSDLTTQCGKLFENIVRKGENARNQHFLFFPQCSLSYQGQISSFGSPLICCLQMLTVCCLVQSYQHKLEIR